MNTYDIHLVFGVNTLYH